jgi:asparagine synthase (glutamine-hydrolysing)
MCGIGGAVLKGDRAFDIAAWIDRLRHRGPDDSGWAVFTDAGGLHTDRDGAPRPGRMMIGQGRLSIIDLTERGHQPFFSPDGRYCLSYNGEIYNYVELRRSMETAGATFVSDSDTEVLLLGLIQRGADFLKEVVGMYAFALYDRFGETLLLGRDPFGMKPLYVATFSDGLAFGSETNGFYDLPGVDLETRPQAVFNFLRYGAIDNEPGTLVAGVSSVAPGCTMRIDTRQCKIIEEVKGWTPRASARPLDISFEDAVAKVRELFLHSVSIHMRSDVPVAVAASGGLDSSWVLAAMRHLQPDQEIHAFSYTAPGEAVDESAWANIIAGSTGAIHHKFTVSPQEIIERTPHMVRRQGEPVASLSVLAQHMLYDHVHRAGMKVILEGQGADELFGGYNDYVGPRVGSALRRGQLVDAGQCLAASARSNGIGLAATVQYVAQDLLPSGLAHWGRAVAGRTQTPSWINRSWLTEHEIEPGDIYQVRIGQQSLTHALAHDTRCHLTGLLRYGDRNAMAASVESRLPFLTPDLANFALSLPDDYLFGRDGRTKRVLREAMRGLVPDTIVDRRDKIGFAPPFAVWLEGLAPWVEGVLNAGVSHPAIDAGELCSLWSRFRAGERALAYSLWRPINFLAWLQTRGG